MSTIATSSSAIGLRLLAVLAAFAAGAAGDARAEPADEAVGSAAVAPDGQAGADGPEVDGQRLVDLVADAQRRLQLSGYDPGPIDGRMGLRTQRAIRAYQAAARRSGTLEALKGPGREDAASRPDLVGLERAAPAATR